MSKDLTLASWARAVKRSELQEMLSATSRPDIISFALGLPAPELFPRDALSRAAEYVLTKDKQSLQYGPTPRGLKRQIVKMMALRGVACDESQIFLTAGAQQGMNLLVRLLLDHGGQALVEEAIYTGMRQVIEPYLPDVLTVYTDRESGMDVSHVESLLESGARPAFIYAVSDGHNPMSVTLSLQKRKSLAELARMYRVPIIEDDPYGFLYYGDAPIPPIRAFNDRWVFYVGSFSKTLAPGLRSGWLVLPESLMQKVSIVKESADIDTVTFVQRVISRFIDTTDYNEHLAGLRREYKTRRDAMVGALRDHFPPKSRWSIPDSGFFVWVDLPPEIDATAVLKISIEKELVAFIPGQAFCVRGGCHLTNCMRLNFSNCSSDTIEIGVERIAKAINWAA